MTLKIDLKGRISFYVYLKMVRDSLNLKWGLNAFPAKMETPPISEKQLSMAATSWVHMRELLARPWVGVCVPLALSLSSS